MSESKNSHLFSNQLKNMEKSHLERPEFIYRMHRNRFDTLGRIPAMYSWSVTHGWIFKGFLAYSICYLLFTRKPAAPHVNREGYNNYDSGHHVWRVEYLRL